MCVALLSHSFYKFPSCNILLRVLIAVGGSSIMEETEAIFWLMADLPAIYSQQFFEIVLVAELVVNLFNQALKVTLSPCIKFRALYQY